MHAVRTYLQQLAKIHDSSVGTDELTCYAPLLNLLNNVPANVWAYTVGG